jgi:glycosyltransferase involved in cell wall biosynthesis
VPAVTVIVPARDAAATIVRSLDRVAAQEVDHELIVVDDGSRDATRALAEERGARVLDGGGRGPAAARNRGAAEASAPVLAFLDADCFPTPGWLAAGRRALERADLAQGAVRADPGAPRGPFDRTLWVTDAWGLFESANLFVRRDAFERLGGFEGWLGQATAKELAEDTWLGWRARRAGLRTAFADDALVHHAVFPRGPAGYVAERARLRFFPALAARVPELREGFFFGRAFLSRRSAAFDLAAAGAATALATRRAAPLLAAAPYAAVAVADARRWGGRSLPKVVAVNAAADAVGAAALAYGSVKARSPLV